MAKEDKPSLLRFSYFQGLFKVLVSGRASMTYEMFTYPPVGLQQEFSVAEPNRFQPTIHLIGV